MPNAIIVGASKGLGLGLVRAYLAEGWNVIATVRSRANPDISALADRFGSRLSTEICDINDERHVAALGTRMSNSELDLLFVNAGISNGPDEIVEQIRTTDLANLLETNALSPMKVIDTLIGSVRSDGVIAVMSSNLASVANNTAGGWEGYRASKAALNTFMRSYASRRQEDMRTYLAISPGWVRTNMGGNDAPLDVETSVTGILKVIASRRGNRGITFVNYANEIIAW